MDRVCFCGGVEITFTAVGRYQTFWRPTMSLERADFEAARGEKGELCWVLLLHSKCCCCSRCCCCCNTNFPGENPAEAPPYPSCKFQSLVYCASLPPPPPPLLVCCCNKLINLRGDCFSRNSTASSNIHPPAQVLALLIYRPLLLFRASETSNRDYKEKKRNFSRWSFGLECAGADPIR